MSTGLRVALGIVTLLCAVGFVFVGLPPTSGKLPDWFMLIMGAFSAAMSVAFLSQKLRAWSIRVIGAAVFLGTLWLLLVAISPSPATGMRRQPSLWTAVLVLVLIGVTAAFVAIRGFIPRLGSNRRTIEGAGPPRNTFAIGRRGIRRLEPDDKFVLGGFSVTSKDFWEIHRETDKRVQDMAPQWRKRLASSNGLSVLLLLAIIVAGTVLRVPAMLTALAATAALIVCMLYLHGGPRGARTRVLRQVMWERGFPVCLECGYNMSGAPDTGCPECGWRRDKREGCQGDDASAR